ncbi:uncharacterized protein LOC112575254 [Pomacea canaliculata]|uniref:uncharacterized protein LOC112575254 n=1 Tax=Pomacea canaliculata TaxID=400727 RepID=UPI000D72BB39|nr:uncharacterized protein LOC112575254 [Pomacea canaliculata]
MAGHPSLPSPQGALSSEAEQFWIQWVEAAFPDLDSRAYFLPPVYFNRVPMTRQSAAGQNVLVLQSTPKPPVKLMGLEENLGDLLSSSEINTSSNVDEKTSNHLKTVPSPAQDSIPQPAPVQDSDIRNDAAMQRVLFSLQKLSEKTKEVLVGISQLQFGQYLGEPCYAAAAKHLPRPDTLPSPLSRKRKEGDFDVLLIHRQYGLVICEVKAFGDNLKDLSMKQQDIDKNIRKKLKDAITQLDKAEAMLSHLVSDIAPGLRISKTIAVPNLTAHQVQQAVSGDFNFAQDMCRCLGTTDLSAITGLCLCSDQMSDHTTPGDVSSDVLREMENWWQRRVAETGPDSHMTCHVYKTLVARFCGPATTVTILCTSSPRLCVKTLGQAVSWTGECYTALITLFPEQVDLLNTAPLRVFVAGPPGTGKTVVLLLMGTEWLRCGHDVYIVSSFADSRASCIMLYHLLLQSLNTLNKQVAGGTTPGQLHILQYEFDQTQDEDVEKAVNDLTQAARGGSVYVIADEAGGEFKTFCDKLLTRVPRLHLWAASCFHAYAPAGWQVEYFTRPLRSPPAVIREVEKDGFITDRYVHGYSDRGVCDHTDGPPVRRLFHRGQGHSRRVSPVNCVTCGLEVASFLRSLNVGARENTPKKSATATSTSGGATPPCLQWRDVLVLYHGEVIYKPVIAKSLKAAGIPVRVVNDDDIENIATARSNVLWVVNGEFVRGLERKVVVFLESTGVVFTRLHVLSRCTSQLVIVSP